MKPASYSPRLADRVELADALPHLGSSGSPAYESFDLLVTIHNHPLGTVTGTLPVGGFEPQAFAQLINQQLGAKIQAHLQADQIIGAPLTADGFAIDDSTKAKCWDGLAADKDLPFVSIVIATKDRTSELERCLGRLLDLDYPRFEILVIDNGASDTSTKDLVIGFDERVRYLELQVASTSLARNLGTTEARGEIIAFTDDDVVLDRYWLRALARGFAHHQDVACVTGLVVPASYDYQAQQWFEEYGGFNKGYQPRVYGREREDGYTVLYPYTAGVFGSGNNAAFRRDALLKFGGFDRHLGPGTPTRAGEDLDAFLAVILNGHRIAYEPSAIISHFHREDYLALERQLFNYGIGLTAVFTKWFFRNPRYAREILFRVPRGVWMVLNPNSAKNAKKSPSFPKSLNRAEIRGMVKGPFLYWKSRLKK